VLDLSGQLPQLRFWPPGVWTPFNAAGGVEACELPIVWALGCSLAVIIYGLPASPNGCPPPLVAIGGDRVNRRGGAVVRCLRVGDLGPTFLRTVPVFANSDDRPASFAASAIILPTAVLAISCCWLLQSFLTAQWWWNRPLVDEDLGL